MNFPTKTIGIRHAYSVRNKTTTSYSYTIYANPNGYPYNFIYYKPKLTTYVDILVYHNTVLPNITKS